MKVGYTTIMHEPRIKLGLSTDEYCLLDLVYRLSTNPTAPVKNWCNMGKDKMSEFLGIPKRTLFRLINRLLDADFLEKSDDGRLLKTTNSWVKNVVNYDFKFDGTHSASVALDYSASVALEGGAKVARNNNIYNNNKREREMRAFNYLKNEVPSRLEQEFEMPYKSKIKDFEKFVLDFDDKVDVEGLNYFPNILMPRLCTFARNWIQNQGKYVEQQNEAQPSANRKRLA